MEFLLILWKYFGTQPFLLGIYLSFRFYIYKFYNGGSGGWCRGHGINGDLLTEGLAGPLLGGGEPLVPILPGIPIFSVADITSRTMTVSDLRDHLSARAVVCERGRPKKYFVDLLLEFEGRRRAQLNPEDAAAAALEVERLRIASEVERERESYSFACST